MLILELFIQIHTFFLLKINKNLIGINFMKKNMIYLVNI